MLGDYGVEVGLALMALGGIWSLLFGVRWFLRFRAFERWVQQERPAVWRHILPYGRKDARSTDDLEFVDRVGTGTTLQQWAEGTGLSESMRSDVELMRAVRVVVRARWLTVPGVLAYIAGFLLLIG